MKPKYAHILDRLFNLGLIHLHHPRCVYWYGTGFDDHDVEWIDMPIIEQGIQVIHDLEQKDLELRREGTEGFPLKDYNDLEIE